MSIVIALLLSLVACFLVYLSSHHQLCLSKPITKKLAFSCAVPLLIVSALQMSLSMQLLAGGLLFLHWLMLLLVVIPYIAAFVALKR